MRAATSRSVSVPPRMHQAFPVILRAGLLSGALDISAAFITWGVRGVSPIIILQGIASGVLGAKSFQDGWHSAMLGGMFHFLIAFSAATVFYVASRSFQFLTRQPILSGALYGIAVYLTMYWVVLPLSNYHRFSFSTFNTVIAIITHILCVGTPIALIVKRYSSPTV